MNCLSRRRQRFTPHHEGNSVVSHRIKRFASCSILGAMLAGVGLPANEARAQSGVQLYGIVDDALTYTNNIGGGRTWCRSTE
jgi:outer membrane protein OmpU